MPTLVVDVGTAPHVHLLGSNQDPVPAPAIQLQKLRPVTLKVALVVPVRLPLAAVNA
jgi:hypothetical protein